MVGFKYANLVLQIAFGTAEYDVFINLTIPVQFSVL